MRLHSSRATLMHFLLVLSYHKVETKNFIKSLKIISYLINKFCNFFSLTITCVLETKIRNTKMRKKMRELERR